ncbi:YopX family protein [Cytobacillus oceanisediminis]|uniref:YopX family protein n=1 Tax=Cytobacillus oceanisediminis TaxID=665099 RepID=UPI00203F7CDA|nr:YopX family protein [Cytobacillus oceanisediminis]MCM3241303.1 YopX family protein [Cytobacillus oceanisediminis]
MREIKFRAWDNVDFKMYYTGEENNIHFYFDSTTIIAERFKDIYVDTPEGDRYPDVGYEKLEHLKYMQYTGLKDKNGKEIFEGDIVERNVLAFGEVRTFIGQVKMFECAWWIDTESAAVPLWDEMHELKIIGNIYENPELLEEAK